MDGYEPEFVTHNLPLLVLAGLGPEKPTEATNSTSGWETGVQITSQIPPVETRDADVLLKHFEANDGRELAWNGREENVKNKFWVKSVGRGYTIPPRHAQVASKPEGSPASRSVLHSPLSPLTPGSRVFPDGLIDPRWIQKHQQIVPSAYISFYTLSSDPSLSTLHDNQLKTDINHIKNVLAQSGYRTRFIAVLLSELKDQPDVEERLAIIRKATGLDPKTSLFFLPPQSSAVELQAFAEVTLSTIYPLCIEYYRDLSKHSRRKRNRGVVPPPTAPTGTSQTLSSQGWNVRYDFKLGIFAEFRQEADAAVRSYENGYETLLGTDVLESIASWSPRWNEARLLADVLTIRVIRCLLWTGNTTAAVRRWQLHYDRIRDLVDRRGKGSSTYGWHAWVSRFSEIMAQLIQRADLADFSPSNSLIYAPADKTVSVGERLQPWEYLHHPGYWYRAAVGHACIRRDVALAMPEDDRNPPGQSPASQIASRAFTYDTYLCPEPHEENPLPRYGKGVDHSAIIIDLLEKAIVEFDARSQTHLVQELSLQIANESIRSKDWPSVLRVLRPLWQKMTYRQEGYWNIVEEISWSLRNAAAHTGDGGSIIAVDWELMNQSFKLQPKWHYDIARSLEGLDTVKAKPAVVLRDQDVHSFLSGTYIFEKAEGKVGELCTSQLSFTSTALPTAAAITFTEIIIDFEGNSIKPVVLKHKLDNQDDSAPVQLSKISLTDGFIPSTTSTDDSTEEGRPAHFGDDNLTLRPGQTRVFEFGSLLREAGEARAATATFRIASDSFDLDYILKFSGTSTPEFWWNNTTKGRRVVRTNASTFNVLPKPPKMQLRFVSLKEQYYTNESITLQVEILNGEEEDSIADIDLRITGENAPVATLRHTAGTDVDIEASTHLALGKIASAASTTVDILLSAVDYPAVHDVAIKASYSLVSDPETPISCVVSMQLPTISPFEANYDFSPRVHPDPWPSFFNHQESTDASGGIQPDTSAKGLAQKWCLTSRYGSFAAQDLYIEDVDVEVIGQNGGIKCYTVKTASIPEGGLKMMPKTIEEAQFSVFTQKNSLDDRGTATLDVSLAIKWRRDANGAAVNTTVLPVPRLLVSSSEPRVLATISYSTAIPSLIHFDVMIENPSYHFLTFGLNMEPSEDFAFSGVKQSTLQLVPLSRRVVRFQLLPSVSGDWLGPVRCIIRDRYFQKVLKIAPTEGMKIEKDGMLIWVPPLGEDLDT
ncbi:hypothetical protein BP5796_08059 [Coleophoma crateriformis]|uniref:Gryzun putative trafficking through Golgi domain-containing protein n=1 Tax=Coleophoma crateriformis TaxID=565419 RepID=A0A3D8RDB3_9HELO|nr:hypothetical protein BP5796_08059 [Coleophoma crateriformis]